MVDVCQGEVAEVINKLKEVREKNGLSQSELARTVGVSRQVISAIEGNQQSPSLKLALNLATELGVKIEDLFADGEGEQEAEQKEVLTKQQRLNLMNQYATLAAIGRVLDDDFMVKHYEYLEEIFKLGYVYLYDEPLQHLHKEMPENTSETVISILDLHRTMLWSLGQKPSKEDLKRVKFLGFDGNYETSQLLFAQFYQKEDGVKRKYAELDVVNSHHHTMDRYLGMLAEWDKMKRKPQLTRPEIDRILAAGKNK